MSKEDLCRKFVSNPGDEIFELVESLVEIRDQDCSCVFPGKKACTRQVTTPFGFCEAHMKTKKGNSIGILWNDTLEELGIEESEEEEEEVEEEVEEEAEEEVAEEEEEPVEEEVPVEEEKPKAKPVVKRKPKAEETEEESPDDSGVAQYVSQKSDATEPEPEPVKEETEKIRFVRSEHNNFVHPDNRLVVRPRDKVILGVENSSGGIGNLTDEHIAWCEEHGLNYIAQ